MRAHTLIQLRTILATLLIMLCGTATAQTVEYIHTDALGSPIAITNAAGTVIERTEYAPFGDQLNRAKDDRPGYTGHVSDVTTGLDYMQQRYYDPTIGRFLSVDPVAPNGVSGDNFNRYWYANNNPYRFTDPDGRTPFSGHLCDMGCDQGSFVVGVTGGAAAGEAIGSRQAIGAGLRAAGSTLAELGLGMASAPVLATAVGAGALAFPTSTASDDDQAMYSFYHGTSSASAESLMGGTPLSPTIASMLSQHGAPGFYLATSRDSAEIFGAYKGNFSVLRYSMNQTSLRELMSAGSMLQPIPQGGLRQQPPGQELYIPPTAFGVFNGLLSSGQIYITPAGSK